MCKVQLLREHVADRVLMMRHARRWSQRELAAKCGVSKMCVYKIENALCSVTYQTLIALAEAFEVPVSFFVQGYVVKTGGGEK